jgi:hypothetical protein
VSSTADRLSDVKWARRAGHRPRARSLEIAVAAAVLAGCAQKGTVTISIEAPGDARLSPFYVDPKNDQARADSVELSDDIRGAPLGTVFIGPQSSGSPQAIADIPVGHYDLRLKVTGGGKLFGVARTPNIDIAPSEVKSITLSARKPMLSYSSSKILNVGQKKGLFLPLPGAMMLLDTTRPPVHPLPPLPPVTIPGCDKLGSCQGVTASTSDGLITIAALSQRILALGSGNLYDTGGANVLATAVLGARTVPTPRAIAISPDSTEAAITTDQGVSVVRIADLLAGMSEPVPILPLPTAGALAWALDSSTVYVLAGPLPLALDCRTKPSTPTSIYSVSMADPTVLNKLPAPGPVNATDIAVSPDGSLIFAQPCTAGQTGGGGVVSVDGKTVLIAGSLISKVLIVGSKILAVPGVVTISNASPDPTNPTSANIPDVATAKIALYDSGKVTAGPDVNVPLLSISYLFGDLSDYPLALFPEPTDLTVFDMALGPDGNTLVLASRARYFTDTNNTFLSFPLIDRKTEQQYAEDTCSLLLSRNVYRLTQVDLITQAISFEADVGADEVGPCQVVCTRCYTTDKGYPKCQPTMANSVTTGCGFNDGFVPSGLSIVFGAH